MFATRRNPPPWTHPHPVRGRKLNDYLARTFSCWGDGRTHIEGKHYSWETALRQFVRMTQFDWRVQGRKLFTATPTGHILWSTDDVTVPPEEATARQVVRDVVRAMRSRMPTHYYHHPDCPTRFDRPCDCYRGELLALLDREEAKESTGPYRKIRRS